MHMISDRQDLSGQVAIITGGARGVGRGIAGVLAKAGASVVITARRKDTVDEVVAEIIAAGGKALGVPGDATSLEDAQATVDATIREFGRLDIMVNNVGGACKPTPLLDVTGDMFMRDFNLNVISAFNFTKLSVPHMRKTGGGSVVNISSRASGVGPHTMTTYAVAKAGLETMTRMMAQAFAPDVRVNAICIGLVESDGLGRAFPTPEAREKLYSMVPLHRVGDPEDPGLAALYFCHRNCFATGQVLAIDGGITQPML